jgi:hypothetical protein
MQRLSRWLERRTLVVLLAGPVLLASVAIAGELDPCRSEARGEFRTCKRSCRDTFREAKDTCSRRDPVCVDDCRTLRRTCQAPFEPGREAAIAVCDAALRAAKHVCRAQFDDGAAALDACIDQAQGVAFSCRDDAREAVAPDLRQCRIAFRQCVRDECPVENAADRTTVRACKRDARDLLRRCAAGCREGFQLATDTCLDRDHVCVEGCRTTRADCRAPLLPTFDAALEVCATTRGTSIDNCRTLYGAGTTERDRCIDQAQLDAFRCRDTAREAARPGLNGCRETFQACARGCPPPGASPSGAFLDR